MITVRRSEERGRADHGWLLSYHTFSFAGYYDPQHMGFQALRVINQDLVQPGHGFPLHPHREMEIISYVLAGQLEHEDTMGHGGVVGPGEVQVISAGTGMAHGERNPSRTEPVHFLQIWIEPAARYRGQPPAYAQKGFSDDERRGRLRLLVSGDGRDGSATIRQDAGMYAALLEPGDTAMHALQPGRGAWVHVARGSAVVNDVPLGPGDGASLEDEVSIRLTGTARADVVVFDLS